MDNERIAAVAKAHATISKTSAKANNTAVGAEFNNTLAMMRSVSSLDVGKYFDKANTARLGNDKFQDALASTANIQSKNYLQQQNRLVMELMEAAALNEDLKDFVELIPDPLNEGEDIPVFAALCRGVPPTKVHENRIMNALLVNLFFRKKNKLTGQELSPKTWETNMKALLASLHTSFGISHCLSHFKGYTGCLDAVAAKFWAEEEKKNPNFGKSKAGELSDEEHDLVLHHLRSPLFKQLVEKDARYLLMALNWTVGTFFALRGRKEHHALKPDSFSVGTYNNKHPLKGLEYLEMKDKNILTKVNMMRFGEFIDHSIVIFRRADRLILVFSGLSGNTDARSKSNNGDVLRYPIVEGDYSNVGFCFKEMVKALPPNAKALYLYPCTASQIVANRAQANNLQRFRNAVVGINTIGNLIKELCVSAGMPNGDKKTPHMMRRFVCTTLANDPNVNENEVARTLRHKSTASQKAYIAMNQRSEMARTKSVLGAAVVDSMIEQAANDDNERKLTPQEMQALQAKPSASIPRSDQSFTLPDASSSSSEDDDDDSSSSSDSDNASENGVMMPPPAFAAAAAAPKKKKKQFHNNPQPQQPMMPYYNPYAYGMMQPGYAMPGFGYGMPPMPPPMAAQMAAQAPPMPPNMQMMGASPFYGYPNPPMMMKASKKKKKGKKKHA